MGAPEFRLSARRHVLRLRLLNALALRHVHRPLSGVGTERAKELVGARHLVRDGNADACGGISLPLQLKMEEHDELPRLVAEEDLGTLQHAAVLDVVARLVFDLERDPLVLPPLQVVGRIDVHANMRLVAGPAVDLVLTVEVVFAAVRENPAAMRIDGMPGRVVPHLAVLLHGLRPRYAQREAHSNNNTFLHFSYPLILCGISMRLT